MMERGLHRKVGLYEDWCDTPVPHNTNCEIEDIISLATRTIDTNEVVSQWENPKYRKEEVNNETN